MRRMLLVLLLVCPLFAADVHAANRPHAVFDAAASEVAGKPVSVWCEMDGAEWERLMNQAGYRGWQGWGFTYPDTPVVYMSPTVCHTLHSLLGGGVAEAGAYWGSLAISTIAHEAVHQTGVAAECRTNASALGHVRSIAIKHFGVKETVASRQVRTRVRTVTRKVRGTFVKIKVREQYVVTVQVPNPELAALEHQALGWHLNNFVAAGLC